MLNNFFSFLLIFLVCVLPLKANEEVLLTVDGEDVSLSEFLYCYGKVKEFSECTPVEYFQTFLRGKLKVADARRMKLEACENFHERFEFVKHYLYDGHNIDENDCMSEMVKIELFTYRLPQGSSDNDIHTVGIIMNDIYHRLVNGVSICDILSVNKDSNLSFEDFDGKWLDRTFILDEVNSEIDRQTVGSVSKPVYSPEGIHIVLLKDKGFVSKSSLYDGWSLKQVEEGLLLLEWEKKSGCPYKNYSEKDLQQFFRSNKNRYRWNLPHYKGVVVHCKNRKVVSKLRKRLKKQPCEMWNDIVETFCIENNVDLRFETGVFQIGNNKYVDKLAFGCGEFEEVDGYPYTAVIGKCLDYEPEDFSDVYDEVVKDYISESEMRFFEGLESKFNVEKHLDVLKTVNCGGSN